MNNIVGKILKIIGIVTIILGLISGWVVWALIAEEFNSSLGFSANLVVFGSSFISGMFFIGLSEIIFLLQSLCDKEKTSLQKEQAPVLKEKASVQKEKIHFLPEQSWLEKSEVPNPENKSNDNVSVTQEKSKVKIVFDNAIKEEDFHINISAKIVFRGRAKSLQEYIADCSVGKNIISLANSCFETAPMKFDVLSNKTTEIHIRSTATSYKIVSIHIQEQ